MKNNWIIFYVKGLLQKKSKRLRMGLLSLCFAYTSIFLLAMSQKGVQETLVEEIYHQGDAYTFSFSKCLSTSDDSSVSIVKTISPTIYEAEILKKDIPSLEVGVNISYFFPGQMTVDYEEKSFIANIKIVKKIDEKLLIEGQTWSYNMHDGIIINEAMAEKLKTYDSKQRSHSIEISNELIVYNFYNNLNIKDTFSYHQTHQIIGVIKEFSWQATPIIYLSYDYLIGYLKDHYLYHYSLACGAVISWNQFILNSPLDSPYRSYGLWLFVDNQKDIKGVINLFNNLANSEYILESSIVEYESLFTSIEVIITWILELLVTFTLIVMVAEISYLTSIYLLQDENDLGILYALGAESKSIGYIYIICNLIVNFIAIVLAKVLSIVLGFVINITMKNKMGLAFININIRITGELLLGLCTSFLIFIVTKIIINRFQKKEIDYLIKEM